ncbi:ATP-dependent helicase, partial [Methanocalculus natronophilus]|uniref:ATP-dependent helicase n=1 Tax=Methanocalculus natronophilus TaxID=1262400 RepID=UPI0031B5EE72
MDILIKDLNEAQQKAVSQTEGPVMAIAGAGSGKTNVLTKRIAFLINNVGVPKDQILAITFTNKAANEMKVRIAKLLNAPTQSMWISTFHSMCARILREHIEYLGYDKRFQIIDDDDTVQMIKSIQKEKGIDTKTIDPRKLKTHVMNLKSEDVNISHYKEPLSGYLNIVFPEYVKRLKENNLVDFEDLIMLTIKLFKQETHLLNHYQKLFQYILVDEFQDTNNAQYE